MQNKAPQGNHDPIPTPERELERYGVWVKAEPQDIPEDQSIDRAPLEATSTDGSDAILLSEEEDLLDPFDFSEEDALETADALTDESTSLEELDSFGPVEELGATSQLQLDETTVEDSMMEIELEELESDDLTLTITDEEAVAEPVSGDDFSTTEVDMDEFGFAGDTMDLGVPAIEITDAEKTDGSPVEAVSDDFESLDMDLQFDDTIPSLETGEAPTDFNDSLAANSEFETVDLESIGLESSIPEAVVDTTVKKPIVHEETALDAFIDEDQTEDSSVFPELAIEDVALDDSASTGFDDVKAVSDDLSSHHVDASSDLLQKIALELSSIKEELVSLRSQLSNLKATGEAPLNAEPSIVGSEEETIAGGFFDDEDDDTIALTGDELDNILNTADFTEEPGADEELDEQESVNIELPNELELLPEDGNYAAASGQGIETIEIPAADVELGELSEIISNEGVTPLASPPEDTSFLDSDSGEVELELDGVPLEDVPLVEPDPSDLEIIIDDAFGAEDEELPLIESAGDGMDVDEIVGSDLEPEMILDLEADEAPVISTVDSFPASMDEIEDAQEIEDFSSSGGLDLLEETPAELFPDEESPVDLEEELVIEDSSISTDHLQFHPDDVSTSLDDSLFVEKNQTLDDPKSSSEFTVEDISEIKPPVFEPTESPKNDAPIIAGQEMKAPESLSPSSGDVPDKLKHDVKSVLMYLDQLLASLPEEKIEEFASSEYYDTYKRLFDDLGLI
jgi:hypothetical protein